MRIASKEKSGPRVHNVAGKDWKFEAEAGTDGPLVCDVTDQEAQAVFLDERNENTFYSLDPSAKLKRGSKGGKKSSAGGEEATAGNKPSGGGDDVLRTQAALLVQNDAATLLALLDQVQDKAILAEVQKQEVEGAARADVLAKLAVLVG